MIGSTISHYRILEELGRGGMGIVYKAEDTKLQRTVALKFLPRHLTSSHEEQARFLQEARAASALNHPNVCTIYAIEEEKDQLFIAMEYVDGMTLREKIRETGAGDQGSRLHGEHFGGQAGIRSQEAIGYAIQIGEALQEAHGKGIIHRDVKTDNIMVTTKNLIKVMDFGLAKLKGSMKLTKTTSTVGTLAYMAPEQIEHETVDARSDLFSMGVVLYEMLTGHLPFRGEHEAAMMYSIINEEPEPIQQFLPDVSSELIHIINRALDKDPEDRYQSAHDMVIDLRRMKKGTAKVVRPGESPASALPTGTTPQAKPARRGVLWTALGGLVAVAAAIAVVLSGGGQELNPDMKLRVLQTPLRNIWYGDLSADGNWLVFPASDEQGKFDVYMMNVAGGQPRRVTTDSSTRINGASLSRDGSTILYARYNTTKSDFEILSVPSVGGTSREIIEQGFNPSWRADGQRIAYMASQELPNSRQTNELWTSRPDGSDRRCELADTAVYRLGIRSAFSFSQDWKSVAWTRNYDEGHSEIVVRDLESGHERRLTSDRKFADDPLWLPTGHIVFSSTRGGNANLWIVPASGGELVQLTKGSGPDAPIGFSRALNRLVYIEMQEIGQIKVANLETHTIRQLTVDDRVRGVPSISEDGRYVAFPEEEGEALSMTRNIYVMDRQGGTARKLTDDDEYKANPKVSPDGKWVLYASRLLTEPAESSRVFLLSVSSPGRRKPIGPGSYPMWITDREFLVWHSARTFKGSIEREGYEPWGPDSTVTFPILQGAFQFTWDLRAKKKGMWIAPTPKGMQGKAGAARQLLEIPTTQMGIASRANELFYQLQRTSGIRRMSLPGGKDRPLDLKLPGVISGFSVRPDGKEIVYRDYSIKARYVAIENLFK